MIRYRLILGNKFNGLNIDATTAKTRTGVCGLAGKSRARSALAQVF